MGTNITINTLCDIMNNEVIGDPLARYAKVNSLMLQTYGSKCLYSNYKNMITSLQNTSWSSGASEGGKQCYNRFNQLFNDKVEICWVFSHLGKLKKSNSTSM